MFVKLVVVACFVAVSLGQHIQPKWNGPLAGGEPASKYPAGVSPQACPNFPNCANPAVAANPSAPYHGGFGPAPVHGGWNGGRGQWNGGHGNQWNGAPAQYNAGPAQYNAGPAPNKWNGGQQDVWNNHANPLDRGEYIGDGDYKGEGLPESGAYGPHPSWNQNQQAAHAPAPAWNAAPHYSTSGQLPAGVSPHACPNYPYCH